MATRSSSSTTCSSDPEDPLTLEAAIQHLLHLDDEAGRRFLERCLSLFPMEQFLTFLKDESERYQNVDPHASLRLAEALICAGGLADLPDHRALGIMAKGDALRALGRFQESVAALDEAGEAFLAHGNEVGWARTRIGWLYSSHCLGRGEAALAALERARAILVTHNQLLRAGTLDSNAGWVCYELGRYDRALALYDRALATFDLLGQTAEARAGWVKANKAVVLTALGDFQAALRLHEEVRHLWERLGDPVSAIRQEHNIAYVYAGQGHYTRALRHYGAVLEARERAGLDSEVAWVALNMAECYLRLNRNGEALELAEEAVRCFERCETPTEAAKARFYCALAEARAGAGERALALLDATAHTFAEVGLVSQFAMALLQRAMLFLDAGNWSAAREEAERARALFAEHGLRIQQAHADLVRARVALGLGDGETAAGLARSALAISQDWDVPWLAHECHHVLGNVARARADFEGALTEYGLAVTSIERLQTSLAVELRENFLADKLTVYEDTIATSLRLAKPDLAFAYLERAKSRALVDYLANNLDVQIRSRGGVGKELANTLARLREEHNWFYNRLYGYGFAERIGDAPEGADEASLRAAVRDREKRIARILEQLALERSEGLALAVTPADEDPLSSLRRSLDDGAVLLEYYLQPEGGVVFVVSRDGLVTVPLPASLRDIHRLLRQWQLNLAATAQGIAAGAPLQGLGRNARGILGALYRALVAPVAAHLSGRDRLVIVPYGPSHAVPFHALHDGECYLLERFEVSSCPSSRLLQLCARWPRRGERSALVVAHTDGGRLPFVLEEARAVAALLPGESYLEGEATRAAVATAAPRHGVLHLAAHGEARLDNPAFAHLKLADGQLSTVDVFNLELHGALVTLSACETGRSAFMGGDELVGLSRGFLSAGAATLVQSLWRVEDGSTADLMWRFYLALRDGHTKGQALREAQLGLLGAGSAHPYFWAPFQLLGDGGAL